MSTAEEIPILIPSEDEEEDGDEVQYIKEEKAPPITIDENEDQDDVIFVSTSPPPPPTMPSTWEEEIGISDTLDLDSFSLGTSSSCSDLTHVSGSSNLGATFCPISDLLDNNSPQPVTVSSSDLSSISGVGSDVSTVPDVKLSDPVLGSSLSLGANADLGMNDSSMSGPGLQVHSGLSTLGSVTTDLNSISHVNNVSLPSVSQSDLNSTNLAPIQDVCSRSGGVDDSKTLLGADPSQSSLPFSATSAFRPAAGPLDLSHQDKNQQVTLPNKPQTDTQFSSCVSYMEESSSAESDTDMSDTDSDDSNDDCLPSKNQVASTLPSIPQPPIMASCASDVPSVSACSPTVAAWLDLGLSSDEDNCVAPATQAQVYQVAVEMMVKLKKKLSNSPVIPATSTPSHGAIPTTVAQSSFSSNDISQTSGFTHTQGSTSSVVQSQTAVSQTLSSDKGSVGSSDSVYRPWVASSTNATPGLQTSGGGSQQAGPVAWGSSDSSVPATKVPCDSTVDCQKQSQHQHQQAASTSPPHVSSTTLDSLDKIVGDCESILARSTASSSRTISLPSSSSGSASSSSVKSTVVAPSTSILHKAADKSADRGTKRHSILWDLDSSSLPPRKRMLKESVSYTKILSSSSNMSVGADNSPSTSSTSMDQTGNPWSAAPGLTRSTSQPCSKDLFVASLLPDDNKNMSSKIQNGGGGASSGSNVLAAGSWTTSKASQDLVDKVTSTASGCCKCGAKEGQKDRDGEECKLSVCCQGHAACGSCLLVQVKMVLTGKQKDFLRCINGSCNSFYQNAELRNSLPSLIVDILHERLDQDVLDYLDAIIADQIIRTKTDSKKVESNSSTGSSNLHKTQQKDLSRKSSNQASRFTLGDNSSDEDDDIDDDDDDVNDEFEDKEDMQKDAESVGCSSDVDADREAEKCKFRKYGDSEKDGKNDFPDHWIRMDNNKNLVEVIAVPLEPDSEEYIQVAIKFHDKMSFPSTDITKIVRIQNPYLWKSYSLKKEQMIQENGGRMVSEDQLFHGTKVNTIDAICRRGFDWRFCGKHGTAYGQGCYFAGDSQYSNTYTDRGPPPSNGSVFLKSITQVVPWHSTDPVAEKPLPASQATHPTTYAPPYRSPTPASSSSNSATVSSSRHNLLNNKAMMVKDLLPLLKTDKAFVAQLLKLKAERQRAAAGGSFGGSKPGTSSQSSATQSSASAALIKGPPGQISSSTHPCSTGPVASSLYGAGRSLLSGHSSSRQLNMAMSMPPVIRAAQAVPHRTDTNSSGSVSCSGRHQHCPPHMPCRIISHSRYPYSQRSVGQVTSSSQAFQQGTSLGSQQGLHTSQQSSAHPPPGHAQSQQPSSSSAFIHLRKPPSYQKGAYQNHSSNLSKKLISRMSSYSSPSGFSRVSALMLKSPSGASQGGGSLVLPVNTFSTNLSMTPTVSLSGATPGAQSLAVLANNQASAQSNSFVLVASLPPPPPNPPLPPLSSLPPPSHPVFGQPSNLTVPKLSPWPGVNMGSSSTSQALDLRKAGSCPRYMFLAKVLTGMATGGQADYRRPPPLDPMDPLGRCYDSCVDNIHTPRIWVIFDSTQAYPEYVIEYVVHGDTFR